MRKKLYFIDRYVRCGAMPLYLIFFHDERGQNGHCVMLCTMKNLRLLLRERKGFSEPEKFGKVIFKSHESMPGDVLRYILKSRYDFDLSQLSGNESRLF